MIDGSLGDRYRHLLPVWVELGRRVGRGERPVRLTVRDLSIDEQSSIADTLGLDRLPGPTTRIDVGRLQAAVGASDLGELTTIAEACIGPVVNQAMVRRNNAERRSKLWHDLAAGLAAIDWISPAGADRFVANQRAGGVGAADIEARSALHARLLRVLGALPANSTSRAVLAAQVLGDPHALDVDTALARLVVTLVTIARDLGPADTAEADRAAWQSVGVVSDQVSSSVLVLGLRASMSHGLSGQLNSAADANEPVVLTLGQLRRWPLGGLVDRSTALVVENPSIVESAARGGEYPWPLICSSGVPTVAVRALLAQLRGAGVRLLQHADFDPSGLQITRWLCGNAGTVPWRMGATDYEQAVAAASTTVECVQIDPVAAIPATHWDPALQAAMQGHRLAIFEEQLLPNLLAVT